MSSTKSFLINLNLSTFRIPIFFVLPVFWPQTDGSPGSTLRRCHTCQANKCPLPLRGREAVGRGTKRPAIFCQGKKKEINKPKKNTNVFFFANLEKMFEWLELRRILWFLGWKNRVPIFWWILNRQLAQFVSWRCIPSRNEMMGWVIFLEDVYTPTANVWVRTTWSQKIRPSSDWWFFTFFLILFGKAKHHPAL